MQPRRWYHGNLQLLNNNVYSLVSGHWLLGVQITVVTYSVHGQHQLLVQFYWNLIKCDTNQELSPTKLCLPAAKMLFVAETITFLSIFILHHKLMSTMQHTGGCGNMLATKAIAKSAGVHFLWPVTRRNTRFSLATCVCQVCVTGANNDPLE